MATDKTDLDEADFTFLGGVEGGVGMWIRPALYEQDHEAIEHVAKQSAIGKVVLRTGRISEDAYALGGVRVLVDREADGTQRCVGFSVFSLGGDETMIYLIAVAKSERKKGVGRELFLDVTRRGSPRRFASTLPKNGAKGALAFSSALGFTENGRTAKGGTRLRLESW